MASYTKEYQELVLDDLKRYRGLSQPVKVSLIKRLIIRSARLKDLHPNPEDEFCDPNIGPNLEIVGRYASLFQRYLSRGGEAPMDRIAVERMSTGGYMILNGHHRWFAAHRVDIKRMPIEIANVIPREAILKRLADSSRQMCVSFDLDEVLLTDRTERPPEDAPFYYKWLFKRTLRDNVPALIEDLQAEGFDVWIYTGSTYSEKYLKALFSMHGAHVDGMINCMSKKKFSSQLRERFLDKYRIVAHIDNDGLLWVDTRTKAYDMAEFHETDGSWAVNAINAVRNLMTSPAQQ